jgi:hypothetical protein
MSTGIHMASIVIKTKTIFPQAQVTIADFGFPVYALWLSCSHIFFKGYFSIRMFRLWGCLVKVIPEKRRV